MRYFALAFGCLALLVCGPAAGQAVSGSTTPGGTGGVPAPLGNLALRPSQAPDFAGPPVAVEDASSGRVAREPQAANAPASDGEDTTASIPLPARPVRPALDPYEPLGISTGGFVLYPSLTIGSGFTTNAKAVAGGSPSAETVVTPELSLRSNWGRHELTFDLRGTDTHFFSSGADDMPQVDAAATARLDLSRPWTVPLSAAYSFRTQQLSDPDFPAGVDFPPGVHEFRGTVGINRTGPLILQASADVDRTVYENGTSGGAVVDQVDRINTVYGGKVRVGYGTAAGTAAFVQAEAGRRQFDQPVDGSGIRRSGLLSRYAAGLSFDRSPVLTGELALGYGIATFDDPALATIRAFTVDGLLVWAPTRLTTLTFTGTTSVDPSTNPASSGSVVYAGLLDLAYAWRANVTLDATAGVRNQRTGETQTDTKAGLAATWKANRQLWLTAGYEHEWFNTNFPGDYAADTVRVQLRAQR